MPIQLLGDAMAPGFGPSSAQVVPKTWGVNQQMDDFILSLPLSPLSLSVIKSKTPKCNIILKSAVYFGLK